MDILTVDFNQNNDGNRFKGKNLMWKAPEGDSLIRILDTNIEPAKAHWVSALKRKVYHNPNDCLLCKAGLKVCNNYFVKILDCNTKEVKAWDVSARVLSQIVPLIKDANEANRNISDLDVRVTRRGKGQETTYAMSFSLKAVNVEEEGRVKLAISSQPLDLVKLIKMPDQDEVRKIVNDLNRAA